tara:strand:+ start:1693 stop:1836 length:144 start_codon:yes stop_codon:yes gene_type:complete
MENSQSMKDIWSEISIPKLINEKKKEVIQEIMHDDLTSQKKTLKEGE